MTKTFYIYQHRRADTGEVFYIGKGTRTNTKGYQRANELKRRSTFWNHIANKTEVVSEVLVDFFAECDAFHFEALLISQFGRRDIGTGSLVNMTDGGEGMSGFVHSSETIEKRRSKLYGRTVTEEHRAKTSAALCGERHPLFGKHRSQETRMKQSGSLKGLRLGGKSKSAKKVVDNKTGRIFPSTRDAAEYLGIKMRYLSAQLAGERRNKTTMEYC